MSIDQWNVAILRPGNDERARASVAVLSDRQLSLAALTVILTLDGRREAGPSGRGAIQVRSVLQQAQPCVIVIESVSTGWREFVDIIDPDSRTLLLLDLEADPRVLAQAIASGADGFLTRAASPALLEGAIAAIVRDGEYIDPALDDVVLHATAVARSSAPLSALQQLSPRETGILTRVASGRSSKEIAREYGVTSKTVCNHVSNIYAKLHLRHRGQLVLYAAQAGLTQLGWEPLAQGA